MNNSNAIANVKGLLHSHCKRKDLGVVNTFLDMEIKPTPVSIYVKLNKNLADVFGDFSMCDCNPIVTPLAATDFARQIALSNVDVILLPNMCFDI